MRPINKKNFGNAAGASIKVRFHNGTTTVTGYIVAQIGTSRFVVTSDGTNRFTVTLADNTTLAGALTVGYATIRATPFGGSIENVKKITSKRVYTTQGSNLPWVFTGAAAGQATVEVN